MTSSKTSLESNKTIEIPRRKKVIFGFILLLVVYLVMEILAQLAFRSVYGFSYRPAKLVRLTSSSWMANQDDVGLPAHFSQLAIHPYMGFAIQAPNRTDSDFGFTKAMPSEAFRKNSEQLSVLIVGGSVAMQLSNSPSGQSVLEKSLREKFSELNIDKKVLFFSAALPGFKQPQQLLSHAYLASLGAHFDLVINVDGFNEMTLAMLEGKPKGLHLAYPRGWDSLVGGQVTAVKLRSIGRLLRVRDQQESTLELALSFPRSAVFGLYFANRVIDNESNATLLVAAIEHSKNKNSLTFEAGGPTFNHDTSQNAYDYLANLWLNSSKQLALAVEANGGQYIQVFQPNQYLEGSKPLSELEKNKFYLPDEAFGKIYGEALPSFKTVIKELQLNSWFVDSSMIYQNELATVYSDICCHFNDYGLELLADFIAAQVIRGNLALSDK